MSACVLSDVGLTWLFAFFAIDRADISFQILFCIFNSMQGFLIFLFMIVRDKSVRDLWMKLVRRLALASPCKGLISRTGQPIDSKTGNTTNALPQTNTCSAEMEMDSLSVKHAANLTLEFNLDQDESKYEDLPGVTYYQYQEDTFNRLE